MNNDRISQLEQFIKDDPLDPFPLYALALEWFKSDLLRSESLFDQLLSQHPDYVPAYYHAGVVKIKRGQPALAHKLLEQGKRKAMETGDQKTAAEIQSLLDELE